MNRYRVLLMLYIPPDTNGKVLDEYTVDADDFDSALAQAKLRSPDDKAGECLFVTWDKGNEVIQ